MYDIIVVGGGPAGMTAALYALRNGKRVLVLEKNGFGGQIAYSPKVENYPGSLQLSGSELAERMLDQILAQGAEVELEKAVSVEDLGDRKTVRTEEGGAYDCRALILAPGVKHRLLGLPAPAFAHCPLLLAPDGRRLSKRDGDQSLENLRDKYTAQEIVGKLAYAYGLQPEPAPRTPESLIGEFSWEKVPKQDVCLPEGLF